MIEQLRTDLLTLIDDVCREVIGESEIEYSNLDGSAGYWEKHGRNQLRAEQRQRLATMLQSNDRNQDAV